MKYIDDPKLLELRFSNGMLILPFFYGRIMAKLNNQTYSGDGARKIGKLRRLISFFKSLTKLSLRHAKIIGLTNTRWEYCEDGEWRNIQHGYYYDLFPDSFLMLEDPDSCLEWKTFKTREPMSTACFVISSISRMLSIVFYKLCSKDRKDFYDFNKLYSFISIDSLRRTDFAIKVQHLLWRKFLKRVQPRVILMHCGSYGSGPGLICKVAHELNIVPIDTQHGQVYHHKVYSASKVIRNSEEYMEYMPDYFYSYGKYWSNCVDWNYKKIEVGNPHLNKYVKKYSKMELSNDFLIISQPTDKEQQHSFIKELASLFPDKVIKVRLHPFETLEVEKKYFSGFSNISVSDSSMNLYADMCGSRQVIGWCSTCLAELLAFGRVPVIVNTPLARTFPRDLGIWISSPKEIKSLSDYQPQDIDFSSYWHQDFENTVKSHLDSLM